VAQGVGSSILLNHPTRDVVQLGRTLALGARGRWFMKYIRSADEYGMKATKRGFYKIMDKELIKGNMCTFFASITQAGIVTATKEWNGSFTECIYTKGPNWDNYLNGHLERYHYGTHGAWNG
jgi:hypothetical protein